MKITTVQAYDWAGFYLDGELKQEGHSIRYDILIEELIKSGQPLTEEEHISLEYEANEWLEERGNLPKRIEDIPEELIYRKD